MFSRTRKTTSAADDWVQLERLKTALSEADVVMIGAGAGLSTSAGLSYNRQRFL